MSVATITAAWKVQCEPSQKLVLLALADHANDETYRCWPSLTHLCKKTGLGRSTVARCLKDLEQSRLIGRSQRGTQTTMYTLNVANWSQHDTSANVGLVPDQDGGSATEGPGVVPQRDGGSATVAHGTVSEPSKEPSSNRKGRAERSTQPAKKKTGHGSRLPDDFELTEKRLDYGIQQGLDADAVRSEFDKFTDHWRAASGQNARKSDWDAAWRNWCRRAIEFRGSRKPASISEHNEQAGNEFLRRIQGKG